MLNRREKLFSAVLLLVSLILFTGCASSEPKLKDGMLKEISSSVVERKTVDVSLEEDDQRLSFDYQVGPGDVLAVNVSGRPEFQSAGTSAPGGAAGQGATNTASKGFRVDSVGNMYLPIVGAVKVNGLTVEQIQIQLKEIFREYILDPWVLVDIVEHKSRPVNLLGQFTAPGTIYMDRPYHLLEAIAAGKGMTPVGNLRYARLVRNKRLIAVDIYRLLLEGDTRQNILLKPGDTIYIPENTMQSVLVAGVVKIQGPVPMKNGQLTLTQAVALAGIADTGYDRNIRIIRSYSPTRGELIVVDLEKVLRGEALPFPLMDGDIVYVPKSGITTWNQALNEVLPTLQTIGAILNPFVQIKYLTDKHY